MPEMLLLLLDIARALVVDGLGAAGLLNTLGGVEKRTPDMLVPNGWELITDVLCFCSLVRCSTRRWSLHAASNWLGEPRSAG